MFTPVGKVFWQLHCSSVSNQKTRDSFAGPPHKNDASISTCCLLYRIHSAGSCNRHQPIDAPPDPYILWHWWIADLDWRQLAASFHTEVCQGTKTLCESLWGGEFDSRGLDPRSKKRCQRGQSLEAMVKWNCTDLFSEGRKKKKSLVGKSYERGRFERSTFQSGDKCDLVRGAGYHLNVSKVKPRGISCF